MNWQKEAVGDLLKYKNRKNFLENVDSMIANLEQDFQSVKAYSSDSTPVSGGASRSEDNMLSNIVKRERLKMNKKITRSLVDAVEKGLQTLTPMQRDILNEFFIERERGHVERLMERYKVEKTRVYDMKDEALLDFTISMYGIFNI